MKGKVLFYDKKFRRGIIQDKSNNRYSFHIGEWLSDEPVSEGEEVIFELPKEEAISIQRHETMNFFKIFLEKGKNLFWFGYKAG
ncbi:MAG: hypothetical protein KU29_12545 [Sulfurovum sp. FS06-10]|jgi:hypothetical protein|nr:MAG: hypothetical protein KU29_12545 [Sulfurovum sp. FS06-10]